MTTFATPPAPLAATTEPSPRPFGERFRGLDGLRALAVVLVMLFHLLPGTTVGGYLGVDVFFVISGFLITGLLLRERERGGRIRLGRFWVRRARRLIPAVAVLLLVCSSVALVFGGDVLVGIGRQLLGAASFGYNWLDIASGAHYFNDTTPELFRNLWSLAVEEQFYLLWPIALLVLAVVRRARVRIGIALGVALVSLAAMVTVYLLTGDSTRVYYGTDTHSFGLAIGAALALAVSARPPATWRARTRRILAPAGVLSLAGIVALAVTMSADGALVYRGGLALVAVLTAIAIAACIAPGSLLGRALDLEPVRWVGERSFGLYLWHWPVYVLFSVALPQFTLDNDGLQLLGGAAACVTVAAAILSYRFVETPVRRVGFRVTIRDWWRAAGASRAGAWRGIVASVAGFALITMTGLALVVAPAEGSVQASVEAGEHAVKAAPAPTLAVPTAPAPVAGPAALPMPTGDQITAIGDSVMLAVAPELQDAYPGIDIRAVVSRQFRAAPDLVDRLRDHGNLRPVLVVGLGTNGSVAQADLDAVLAAVGPQGRLVLVTVQAPRDWTSAVNDELTDFAAAHKNVVLADWRSDIRPHLDLLYSDKIHPRGKKGGGIYVDAVTDAFRRLTAAPLPPANVQPFARPSAP